MSVLPTVAGKGEAMPLAGGTQVTMNSVNNYKVPMCSWFFCFTFQNCFTFHILFYHLSFHSFAVSTFIFLLFWFSTIKTSSAKKSKRESARLSLTKYFFLPVYIAIYCPYWVFIAFEQEGNVLKVTRCTKRLKTFSNKKFQKRPALFRVTFSCHTSFCVAWRKSI